mmetsp:Transcript_37368/g.81372  ORF Transcript_37368/g.81372 Transcript_37368/m.81372 type:complete len:224 (+) Transcript_37368:330-1001(+)
MLGQFDSQDFQLPDECVGGESVGLEVVVDVQTHGPQLLEYLEQGGPLDLIQVHFAHSQILDVQADFGYFVRVIVQLFGDLLVVNGVAQRDVVYLQFVDAELFLHGKQFLGGQIDLEVVQRCHELGGVDLAFAQSVLVFEELFGAHRLFRATERYFLQGGVQISFQIHLRLTGFGLPLGGLGEGGRAVGLVGQLQVVEEVPLIYIQLVLRVALVFTDGLQVLIV